jgi:hypothetical protein
LAYINENIPIFLVACSVSSFQIVKVQHTALQMFGREDSLPLSMGGNKRNNGITGNLKAIDKGVRVQAA